MGLRTGLVATSLLFLLAGCVTVQEKETLEMLPRYGAPEVVRDSYLASEDTQFKRIQLQRFKGDARAASQYFSNKASEYLRYGQIQQAMAAFNRAWLLDPQNATAFWGFGQVLVLQDKLLSAIEHLQKAQALGVDKYQMPALLVDLGIAYSIQAERLANTDNAQSERLFLNANHSFKKSSRLAPRYAEVWRRWSYSLYRERRYDEAWDAVKHARGLGAKPLPPSFLKALSAAQQEPESIQ